MKNTEITISFTKIETLFRKIWLITFMLFPTFLTLCFLFDIYCSVFDQNNIFHTKDITTIEILPILLLIWGFFYINYRCSYKKTGTKLLIYRLILLTPTFLGIFLLVIFQLHIVSIVAFSIVSWIILTDIAMLKTNLKYKKLALKTFLPKDQKTILNQ